MSDTARAIQENSVLRWKARPQRKRILMSNEKNGLTVTITLDVGIKAVTVERFVPFEALDHNPESIISSTRKILDRTGAMAIAKLVTKDE